MTKQNPTGSVINEPRFFVDSAASRGSPLEQDNSREFFLAGDSPSVFSSASISHPRNQITMSPAAASKSARFARRRRKLRGSCDFCTKRKRKCDGDGVNRCSLCVAKNQAVCHYSERLSPGPRSQIPLPTVKSVNISDDGGDTRVLNAIEGGCNPREYLKPEEWRPLLGGRGTGEEQQQQQSLGSVVERRGVGQSLVALGGIGGSSCAPLLPLKRARLSPSPATGLIGLKENVYIGDFFRVLGFLPFTEESDIRKAMIAIMSSKPQQRGPAEDGHGEGSIVPIMRSAEASAASCVLWCTVALGYLVEGRPKESVVGYTNLAREALSECFDDGSVGTARAFIAMGILQSVLGNEMKYRKHLEFAQSIIAALPPEIAPEELKATVLHMRVSDAFWLEPRRFGEDSWELKKELATLRRECSELSEDSIQKPNIFRRTDLYRWLIQVDVRMGHSFHKDMFDVGLYDAVSNKSTLANQNRPIPDAVADVRISGGGKGEGTSSVVPPPPGETTRTFAVNTLKEFNALKNLSEISEMCDSVGELYVRSVMAYTSRLEGSCIVALESLERCGDIIVKHPGLCRFTTWKHLVHCILKVLSALGDRNKYSKLREVYNSIVDEPGTRKMPPFEEFTTVSDICDGFFCRSICSEEISCSKTCKFCRASSKSRGFQKLSPPDDGVTPPQSPSLENASSLLRKIPQDGQEQLQRVVPIAHLPPFRDSASGFDDVGVSATGTSLHIPGGCKSISEGRSRDWCSGNSSNSKISGVDVDRTTAFAAVGNEYSGFSGGMSGSPEEQMMPLSLMTTASTDRLEGTDSEILMDAIEAILGDAWQDEMAACNHSHMANQS